MTTALRPDARRTEGSSRSSPGGGRPASSGAGFSAVFGDPAGRRRHQRLLADGGGHPVRRHLGVPDPGVGRPAGHRHRARPVAARPARVRARRPTSPHPGGLGGPGPRVVRWSAAWPLRRGAGPGAVTWSAPTPPTDDDDDAAGARPGPARWPRCTTWCWPPPGARGRCGRRSWSRTSAGSGCRPLAVLVVYLAGGGAAGARPGLVAALRASAWSWRGGWLRGLVAARRPATRRRPTPGAPGPRVLGATPRRGPSRGSPRPR